MPPYLIFQPSPRIPPQLPSGSVELSGPRVLSPPTSGGLKDQIVGTMMPSLVSLTASLLMFRTARPLSQMWWMGASAGIFSLGYPVISLVFRHNANLKKYRDDHTLRNAQYRTRVQEIVAQLESFAESQRNARLLSDPDFGGCLARLERLDARLWERTPADPDFLTVRIGLGEEPLCVELKTPAVDARHAAESRDDSATLLSDALRAVEVFRRVNRTPVRVPLAMQGGMAIVGANRRELLAGLHSMHLQLATHHSPAEVKLVSFYGNHEEGDWIRWLPHTWNDDRSRRYLASDPASIKELGDWLANEIHLRAGKVSLPRYVVSVYETRLLEGHEVWPKLMQSGPSCGIYPLLVSFSADELPREIRSILTLGKNVGELVLLREKDTFRTPVVADQVLPDRAEAFSRATASLRIGAGQKQEVPVQATLLDTLAVRDLHDIHVAERWKTSPVNSIGVSLGLTYGGRPFLFDLLEVGPHGLVAGMPRSGKTEFLVTYLITLASRIHPAELSFICIDYKGGEIFRHLYHLPHLVATLTNLESDETAGYLTRRCLLGLQAELRRRQRLFQSVSNEEDKVKTIAEYHALLRRGRASQPLPRLLIVCDEYRELMTRDPAFVDGLVSVAVVGASLGMHLLLATQNPEGIVTSQIEATVGFRICFRLDQEFSRPFIGSAEPGQIPTALKGRGFFRVAGRPQLEEFQAAYSGSHVISQGDAGDFPPIAEVAMDGRRSLLEPERLPQLGQPQVETLAQLILTAAQQAGAARLAGPWLPPLRTTLDLPSIRTAQGWDGSDWKAHGSWLNPCLGQIDEAASQAQPPYLVNFPQDGNTAVYGKPGSGLTTALRTLAISLCMDHSPLDVHLYIADLGGGSLGILKALPHVGDVVYADQGDKLSRLFRFLQGILQRRKLTFSRAGCTTLESYREVTGESIPAIFLLLDNYAALTNDHSECEEPLNRFAQEGKSLGLYFVFTVNSPSLVKYKLSVNLGNAIALPLADAHDQVMVVGRTEGLTPMKLPGRALIKSTPPLEMQIALPTGGMTDTERGQNLTLLMEQMRQCWRGVLPPPVPMLPDVVTLESLFQIDDLEWDVSPRPMLTSVPVGLTALDVLPFCMDLMDGPQFLVSGGYASGKTTLLRSWLLSLAAHVPPQKLRVVLIDFGHGPLQSLEGLPHVSHFVNDDMKLGDVLGELQEEQNRWKHWKATDEKSRAGESDPTQWLIVLDDLESFLQQAGILAKGKLQELLKKSRSGGLFMVTSGNTGDFSSNSFDPLVKTLIGNKTGVLLGTREDQGLFGSVRLLGDQVPLRAGDGFFIKRGQLEGRFRAATPDKGLFSLFEWIEQITWKTASEVKS